MKINWPNLKFTLYIALLLGILQLSQNRIIPTFQAFSAWFEANIITLISYAKFLLVIVWVLGITYVFWKNPFRTKVWVRTVILLGLPLLFYGYNLRLRLMPVYFLAKGYGDRIGKVYVNDDSIGYKHAPNTKGYRLLGDKFITISHDDEGNRIPEGYEHSGRRPLMTYLGCSVSYGDACWAEESFSHQIAQDIGGDYINAAGSGYGVSQMLIKAQELIPKHKPDYLIVQYTTWLPERSMQTYQTFFGGKFPIPFISERGLERPVFSPRGLKTPFAEFHKTPVSTFDFLKFMVQVGPNFVYQDLNSIWVFWGQLLGFVPKPSSNKKWVEDYAYGELYRICEENGTKMVVWTTGTGFHLDPKLPADTLYKLNVPIAYADSTLYKRHNAWTKDSYAKLYSHWWLPPGQPDSVLVDGHPNALCHRIIADEIVATIRQLDSLGITPQTQR
jgi:hypothetical protein